MEKFEEAGRLVSAPQKKVLVSCEFVDRMDLLDEKLIGISA
jgi:hypothetical protein